MVGDKVRVNKIGDTLNHRIGTVIAIAPHGVLIWFKEVDREEWYSITELTHLKVNEWPR